jgi:hypothetical protein
MVARLTSFVNRFFKECGQAEDNVGESVVITAEKREGQVHDLLTPMTCTRGAEPVRSAKRVGDAYVESCKYDKGAVLCPG